MLRHSFFWFGASFCAGVAMAPAGHFRFHAWAVLGACLLGGGTVLACAARSAGGARTAGLLAAAGYLCAGGACGTGAFAFHADRIDALLLQHPRLAGQGCALGGVVINARALQETRGAGGARASIALAVDRLALGRIEHRAVGIARLYAPLPEGSLPRRGDRLETFAALSVPFPYANPGAIPSVRLRRLRGVDAIGRIKSTRLMSAAGTESPALSTRLRRRADRLRDALIERIDASFAPTPSGRRAAGVAAALLVGERTMLTPDDLLLLHNSGLTHLLAVSGFNVAILAALLVAGARLCGMKRRGAALVSIPCLVVYFLINEDESSVARAVLMASLLLAGRALWRRVDPLNTLGLSGLIIAAVRPAQVFAPGFQLTFAATLGLLLLTPRLMPAGPPTAGARGLILRGAGAMAAATLAATAATLPLVAMHFNRATPGALPANLVAGPLIALAFPGVLLLELAGLSGEALPRLIAAAVTVCVDLTFLAARAVTSVPGMTIMRPTPGPALVLAYYTLLTAVFLPVRQAWRAGLAFLWGILVLILHLPLDTRGAAAAVRITMLDVGQGEAVLIETPSGRRALIDAAGSRNPGFDMGERVVGRALWNLGIARLDLLVISHRDVDHSAGGAAILRGFRPDEVWLSSAPGGRLSDLAWTAESLGIPVVQVRRGHLLRWGSTTFEVLHPAVEPAPGMTENEASLVLRVTDRGRTFLMMGDAGIATERGLPREALSADVLKVGHHGSRSATSSSFLDAVDPGLALISSGRGNPYGHPHPQVLSLLEQRGVRTCRTDRGGAIEVEMDPLGTRLGRPCAE